MSKPHTYLVINGIGPAAGTGERRLHLAEAGALPLNRLTVHAAAHITDLIVKVFRVIENLSAAGIACDVHSGILPVRNRERP